MKLNIGCGEKPLEGYINIDIRKLPCVDMVHDLTKPFPWANEVCDEIIATDVLEHFSFKLTGQIFKEWVRVLKVNGKIEVTIPDIDKHIRMYYNKEVDRKTKKPVDVYRLRHLIFGGQDYEYSYHYTTFNAESIRALFRANNLTCEIEHIQKGMIVRGRKLK